MGDPCIAGSRALAVATAPPRRGSDVPDSAADAESEAAGSWRRCLVGSADRALRHLHGVFDFTYDPDCLLRIASARLDNEVRLAGGDIIAGGTRVLNLHLWNERLPGLPSSRRGLARAKTLRRRIEASLQELAARLAADPSLRDVQGLRAHAAFVSTGRLGKLLRVAAAFGFEAEMSSPSNPAYRFVEFCQDILILLLTWAYNPAALHWRDAIRHHCHLWISRELLIARYGREAEGRGRPGLSTELCLEASMTHVLLVEPDDDFCLTLRQVVSEAGSQVMITGTYAEAMDALATVDLLDLLVTNAVLPGGSGLVLAREAVRLGKTIIVYREGRKHVEVSDWEQPLFRGDRAGVAKFIGEAVTRHRGAASPTRKRRVHEPHR